MIRLFHGAARYNQVFHAIDSLAFLSLVSCTSFLPFSSRIRPLHYHYFFSIRSSLETIDAESKQSRFCAKRSRFERGNRISVLVLGNFIDHPAEIRCRTSSASFKFSNARMARNHSHPHSAASIIFTPGRGRKLELWRY